MVMVGVGEEHLLAANEPRGFAMALSLAHLRQRQAQGTYLVERIGCRVVHPDEAISATCAADRRSAWSGHLREHPVHSVDLDPLVPVDVAGDLEQPWVLRVAAGGRQNRAAIALLENFVRRAGEAGLDDLSQAASELLDTIR
jgi:hypothetical protein